MANYAAIGISKSLELWEENYKEHLKHRASITWLVLSLPISYLATLGEISKVWVEKSFDEILAIDLFSTSQKVPGADAINFPVGSTLSFDLCQSLDWGTNQGKEGTLGLIFGNNFKLV